MPASMEAKRHSLILGGLVEHQIFCQFLSFFLSKTISSPTEAFCYKLTRLSHPFSPMQTDTDVNSLKKIIASSKINKNHFLRIQQCKLNLFAGIAISWF